MCVCMCVCVYVCMCVYIYIYIHIYIYIYTYTIKQPKQVISEIRRNNARLIPTNIIPAKTPRLEASGRFPADVRAPPLKIKVLPESSPPKSRMSRVGASAKCCVLFVQRRNENPRYVSQALLAVQFDVEIRIRNMLQALLVV